MKHPADECRPVLVLTLDALNASYLGPYGNTWLATPGWNQLAAESLLLEQAVTSTTELAAAFEGVWGASPCEQPSVPGRLKERDVPCQFWTDEPSIMHLAQEAGFDSTWAVKSLQVTGLAPELESTRLFSQTREIVERIKADGLRGVTWVHLAALSGPWDAPVELRATLFDEELGDPPEWFEPEPRRAQHPLEDDERLRWQVAYGAQIQVLDYCLQSLLQAFEDLNTGRPTLIVAAPRGCPLGTHGCCLDMRSLWTESVQIPILVSAPPDTRCLRAPQLVSWTDIGATLLELAGFSLDEVPDSLLQFVVDPNRAGRDRLLIRSSQETALRTKHWFLRQPKSGAAELYVKPDDRHDINEVSQRLPTITDQLVAAHAELANADQQSQEGPLLPLPAMPLE